MVDKSGDSVIDKYSYLEGTLILDLDITELEKKIRMTIKTDALSFDNYYLSQRNEIYKVCRIEIQELASVISMETTFTSRQTILEV